MTRPKNALLAYPHLDGEALPTIAEMDAKHALKKQKHVGKVLKMTGWNKSASARILGVDRKQLYRMCEGYGWHTRIERVVTGYRDQPVVFRRKG